MQPRVKIALKLKADEFWPLVCDAKPSVFAFVSPGMLLVSLVCCGNRHDQSGKN